MMTPIATKFVDWDIPELSTLQDSKVCKLIVQRYYGGRMPSTACANNSVDLTTAFHECAISGISLTPCLFTCLISLTP